MRLAGGQVSWRPLVTAKQSTMPYWPGSKVTVFDTVRRKARAKNQAEPQADEMCAIIERHNGQCQ